MPSDSCLNTVMVTTYLMIRVLSVQDQSSVAINSCCYNKLSKSVGGLSYCLNRSNMELRYCMFNNVDQQCWRALVDE